MPSVPIAVGIDVGSTNTKVVALRLDSGEPVEVAVERGPTPASAADLVDAVLAGIRRLLARVDARPVAVGIASMAETGVPLDHRLRPLGDLVRWDRAGAAATVDGIDRAARFEATGVRVGPKTPVVMWRELRDRDPDRWAALHRWAGVADLVALALTDRLVTDHTLAGRTGAYRLPAPGGSLATSFDADLLDGTGLDSDRLPDVAAPGAAAGSVTPAASARSGLPAGIPVVVAGHDHAVVAWGIGARRLGDTADSVGTTEAVLRIARGPIDRAAALAQGMSVTRTVAGDAETLLAGSTGGGAMLAYWAERGVEPTDPDPARRSDAIVLPYPNGRQSPSPDPDARVRVVDRRGAALDPERLSADDLTLATLAGLAMQAHWMDAAAGDVLEEGPSRRILAAGSALVRSRAWLARKASFAPVALTTVEEPAAAAAALRAAVVAGLADPATALPTRPAGAAPADPELYSAFRTAAEAAIHR